MYGLHQQTKLVIDAWETVFDFDISSVVGIFSWLEESLLVVGNL